MPKKHAERFVCRGLGSTSTKLIDAHIIPAGFARLVRDADGSGPIIKITPRGKGRARQQLGEYDSAILCADCDNKLGEYEANAMETLGAFGKRHVPRKDILGEMTPVSGDRLALFALAVIWKASISNRPAFSKILLGRYENTARDTLFGAIPVGVFRDFWVLFFRFQSEQTNVEAFLCGLSRARFENRYAYFFAVAGFRVIADFDPRPLSLAASPFVINGSRILRAPFVELEQTSEFRRMLKMTKPRSSAQST